MGIHYITGRGHGDYNGSFDVPNDGENLVLGSASETNNIGAGQMGTASVYVTNCYSEIILGNQLRIHFRVRVEWPSDLYWKATIVRFKSGGPFGND